MMALLQGGHRQARQVLRIGAVATLSRNFQENFLRPLLERDDVELALQSGALADLLTRLRVHTLDLVLSNRRVHGTADDPWRTRRIARQPVSLVRASRDYYTAVVSTRGVEFHSKKLNKIRHSLSRLKQFWIAVVVGHFTMIGSTVIGRHHPIKTKAACHYRIHRNGIQCIFSNNRRGRRCF
jgi:hypothetical protein